MIRGNENHFEWQNLPSMINWTVFEAILYLHETENEPMLDCWMDHIPPAHWPWIARIWKYEDRTHLDSIICQTYVQENHWLIIIIIINKGDVSSATENVLQWQIECPFL